MKILLAVHPGFTDTKEMRSFMGKQFKVDRNTFLCVFSSGALFERGQIESLGKKLGKPNNLFLLWPEGKGKPWALSAEGFSVYESPFLKVLGSLKEKLAKGEKVEVISFGGAANAGYKRISLPAHEAVMAAFKGRATVHSTYLPLVFGRHLAKEVAPKKKRAGVLGRPRSKFLRKRA